MSFAEVSLRCQNELRYIIYFSKILYMNNVAEDPIFVYICVADIAHESPVRFYSIEQWLEAFIQVLLYMIDLSQNCYNISSTLECFQLFVHSIV